MKESPDINRCRLADGDSSQDLAKALDELAELQKRHQEIIALLRGYQVERPPSDQVMQEQINDLSGRTARMLGILEHLDGLLAQINTLKPLVLAPARLARWASRLSAGMTNPFRQRAATKPPDIRAGAQGCVLMIAVNGVGLGHLTRTLAVARRLRQISDSLQIVLLTTSPAVHLAYRQGVLAYYVPSVQALPQTEHEQFDLLLRRELTSLMKRYRPGAIVYDGIWPYRGLLKGMASSDGAKRYWLRRGRWKRRPAQEQLRAEKLFNLIIEPGEVGQPAQSRSKKYVSVDPITYLDPQDLLGREAARLSLGLPLDHQAVLVSLGAANLNINRDLSMVLGILSSRPATSVVIAESIIGEQLSHAHPRVRIVREFPISRYFNAFDAAVTAAGYNTVHELAALGLPAVLIPNLDTSTDDQLARAQAAHDAGACLCLPQPDESSMTAALTTVLDPEHNRRMRMSCQGELEGDGAMQAALRILSAEHPR